MRAHKVVVVKTMVSTQEKVKRLRKEYAVQKENSTRADRTDNGKPEAASVSQLRIG